MLYSNLFGKTRKTVSKQYESKNHELLTKAGFINQVASGIYTLLPLGNRVHSKIQDIIRKELNDKGAQEISMPCLQPKNLWLKTNRWNIDMLFKTKSRYHNNEYALAPTHEEIVTPVANKYVKSYKDLPLGLYHFSLKFRDEPRAKSGILRGREFQMKDLYSFHKDKEDFNSYYHKMIDVYLKIFKRIGFNQVKVTEASGGDFSKKCSHEFNVITEAGEVDLIHCTVCNFAQNEEISKLKTGEVCPKCKKGKLKKDRAIEIGNIFDLETRFPDAFNFTYTDKYGKERKIFMGCYGIGTTRIIGALVEKYHDNYGIMWPESIAPYQIHLIGLDLKNEEIMNNAKQVYNKLLESNIEVLFDDRKDIAAGEKFADADLIGIPIRLVVSKKTKEKVEFKKRNQKESQIISVNEVAKNL